MKVSSEPTTEETAAIRAAPIASLTRTPRSQARGGAAASHRRGEASWRRGDWPSACRAWRSPPSWRCRRGHAERSPHEARSGSRRTKSGAVARPSKDPVLLHFVLEPASVFGTEVELEHELERSRRTFDPRKPVRSQMELPTSLAPGLPSPLSHPERAVGRAGGEGQPGEVAVRGPGVT
jgi:hypothetical protein